MEEGFSAGLFEGLEEPPLLLQPGLDTVGGTVGGVGPPTKANAETEAKTRASANNGVFMGLNKLTQHQRLGKCILIAIMRGQVGRIIGQLLKGKHLPRHLS